MSNLRKVLPLVILTGLTVGALVGCPAPTQQTFSLELINDSGATMTEMNMQASDEAGNGADQLQGAGLNDGSTFTVSSIPPDIYNLRAVFNTLTDTKDLLVFYEQNVPFLEANAIWEFSLVSDEYTEDEDITANLTQIIPTL